MGTYEKRAACAHSTEKREVPKPVTVEVIVVGPRAGNYDYSYGSVPLVRKRSLSNRKAALELNYGFPGTGECLVYGERELTFELNLRIGRVGISRRSVNRIHRSKVMVNCHLENKAKLSNSSILSYNWPEINHWKSKSKGMLQVLIEKAASYRSPASGTRAA